MDASGNPVVDPTANVLDALEAGSRRQDDLRDATNKYLDARIDSIEQKAILRAEHAKELREQESRHNDALRRAESARLDSIRQVDREDVSKTAAQVLNSVQTLASTAGTTAETLRNQVATTAAQASAQRTADSTEFNKRLSAVELALSEGKGKQTVADPQMERLANMVEKLASARDTGTGKSEGISMVGALIMGGASLIFVLMGIAGVLYAVLKP